MLCRNQNLLREYLLVIVNYTIHETVIRLQKERSGVVLSMLYLALSAIECFRS